MHALLSGLYDAHRLLLVLAALGYVVYWRRAHVWMPRWAHLLAGGSLLLGVGVLLMTPADAPIHREPLGWVRKGAMVVVFPALVYCGFIFYGSQRGAVRRAHPCRRCGDEHAAGAGCEAG